MVLLIGTAVITAYANAGHRRVQYLSLYFSVARLTRVLLWPWARKGRVWFLYPDHYLDPLPRGVTPWLMLTPPRCLLCRPPLGVVDTLTDGVKSLQMICSSTNAQSAALNMFLMHIVKTNQLQHMVYRNKVYRVIILHITYSFWGLRPRPPPGLCPWSPLGDFRPPNPLVFHYTPCH